MCCFYDKSNTFALYYQLFLQFASFNIYFTSYRRYWYFFSGSKTGLAYVNCFGVKDKRGYKSSTRFPRVGDTHWSLLARWHSLEASRPKNKKWRHVQPGTMDQNSKSRNLRACVHVFFFLQCHSNDIGLGGVRKPIFSGNLVHSNSFLIHVSMVQSNTKKLSGVVWDSSKY